ncbi:hypothetical protein ACQEU6_08030 [Spirillospora sp. CA-108201]
MRGGDVVEEVGALDGDAGVLQGAPRPGPQRGGVPGDDGGLALDDGDVRRAVAGEGLGEGEPDAQAADEDPGGPAGRRAAASRAARTSSRSDSPLRVSIRNTPLLMIS